VDPRIDKLQRISAAKRGLLCLAGGLPAEDLFPKKLLADAFVAAIQKPGSPALQYGWPEGSEGLRGWIARRLASRGAPVTPDDVIVTSGAQQALAIATTLLAPREVHVGVDAETYPGALDLFRSRGAMPTASAAASDVDWHYVVPGSSNPRGLALPPERRRALLASGKPLVVDEAYAELRFDGILDAPLLAEAPDRVYHVGTFSKTLCPGLRVGWLVVPRSAREEALRIKREDDLQAGSLGQAVLEAYLARDDYEARLVRARKTYASRAARLVRALRRELPGVFRFAEPEGGFAVFVESDLEHVDEARALSLATAAGVSFDPGSMFRADGATAPFGMRLSCSSLSGEAIDEGVRRLARVMAELRAGVRRAS